MAFPELLNKVMNKADTYNPILTGTPQAPTANAGTNTTQIATTEFVTKAVANKTDITGNAATATKLATSRSITLASGVTGTATFDGSTNVSITTTVVKDGHTHSQSTVDGLTTALASKAPLSSPALTGIPTAPTADATTNTQQLATTAFVKAALSNILVSLSGGVIYKGTVGVGGTYTTLPTSGYVAGWLWTVLVAGTYAGQICEAGDMVVCTEDYSSAYSDDDFTVIQKNIDGAVTGPASSVANRVATFSNTTGKVIKDSGFTIATSVPSGAKFTDTVYTHPTSGVSTGTYKSVTVDVNGHVTAGSNPTTLAGYGITDAVVQEAGKVLSSNDYTTADKTKLAGIAVNANNYSLPTSTSSVLGGVKTGSNITNTSGTISITKGNVTAALGYTPPTTDTTYGVVTTSANGLMSSVDKAKLDGVEANANNYTLPTASTSILGGVKVDGSTVVIANGVISSPAQTSVTGNAGSATKLATARTITLTGDVTGSVSFDGNANVSIAAVVTDDSHNHTIANVDNLQTTLNAKAALNSPALTGTPTAPTAATTVNNTQIATTAYVTTAVANKTDITGNAATATKLATTRTINGVGFDGTSNITVGCSEANLIWGGRNFSGSYGCIDAAMIPDLGANRLAFCLAAGITVEYSRDAGATWTDYGLSASQKVALFGPGGSATIGKSENNTTNPSTVGCQVRITLSTAEAMVYTALNKFAIYLSTNGSSGTWCTIDAAYQATPTAFTTFANKVDVTGWSGWNIINTSDITTYGNTPTTQYGKVRFTFGCTGVSSTYKQGLTIIRIMGFGGVGWTTPSTMAKYGTLYSYDTNQNATFPANITANAFNGNLNGNATSATTATTANSATTATKLATARTVALSGAVSGSTAFDGSGNVTITTISGIVSTTATISTTWTGRAAPYKQTISVSGVTATSVVEVSLPSTATDKQVKAYQTLNWVDGGQTTNAITLRAYGEKNTIAIPINVVIHP